HIKTLEMSRRQGYNTSSPYSRGPRRVRLTRFSDEKYLGPAGDSGQSLANATRLGLEHPVQFANGRNCIASLGRVLRMRYKISLLKRKAFPDGLSGVYSRRSG